MVYSFLYLAVRPLFGVLVRSRRGLHVKDIKLLETVGRALLAAACHRPRSSRGVLLVTPRTPLHSHRTLRKRTSEDPAA
jgi:hypothetical protein